MMKDKEIGKYFSEKWKQLEVEPPVDGFDKLLNDKSLIRYNRNQLWKRIVLYGIAPVAIITVAVLVLNHLRKSEDAIRQPAQSNPSGMTNDTIRNSENQTVITESETVKLNENPIIETPVITVVEMESIDNDAAVKNNSVKSKENGAVSSPSQVSVVEQKPAQSNISSDSTQASKQNAKSPGINNPPVKTAVPSQPVDDNIESVEFDDMSLNTQDNEYKPEMYIPNAFKPNGDGLNDIFKPEYEGEVTDYDMIISDRKGEVLFRSKDINIGWNGEFNGNPVQQGTYIYVIMYRDNSGYRQIKKGFVVIVR